MPSPRRGSPLALARSQPGWRSPPAHEEDPDPLLATAAASAGHAGEYTPDAAATAARAAAATAPVATGQQSRAVITDLRLSTSQRPKTSYAPGYVTLGRGLFRTDGDAAGAPGGDAQVMRVVSPGSPTRTERGTARLYSPSSPTAKAGSDRELQHTLRRATHAMAIANVHSRVFDQLPPRNGHASRIFSPPAFSHEKAPLMSYKRRSNVRSSATTGRV